MRTLRNCICRTDPDLEMEGVLKRHASRVFYVQGSILSPRDMEKLQLERALACMFLTEKNASNPTAEDATSVMSVIAVKNACPKMRCLVQILQSRSRVKIGKSEIKLLEIFGISPLMCELPIFPQIERK